MIYLPAFQSCSKKNITCKVTFLLMSDMHMFKNGFNNLNYRFASNNGITSPSSSKMTQSDIKRLSTEIINYLKKI